MKKIIYIFGITVALLTSGFVNATDKIAIVDVVSILQQMPQREAVVKVLDAEFEPLAKLLEEDEKQASEAAQRLKKDGLTLSAAEKAKLASVIAGFETKAKEFSQDYRRRENEEASKLLTQIQDAVKVIAAKDNYTLVLKAEAAFYVADGIDITDKVLVQVKK